MRLQRQVLRSSRLKRGCLSCRAPLPQRDPLGSRTTVGGTDQFRLKAALRLMIQKGQGALFCRAPLPQRSSASLRFSVGEHTRSLLCLAGRTLAVVMSSKVSVNQWRRLIQGRPFTGLWVVRGGALWAHAIPREWQTNCTSLVHSLQAGLASVRHRPQRAFRNSSMQQSRSRLPNTVSMRSIVHRHH